MDRSTGDMDRIKIGDHFIPLPNSPKHGPKRWRQEMRGCQRTFVEIELTPMDRLQSDLAGVTDFFEASATVTEADAIAEPAMKEYIGGRAIFPNHLSYPTDKSPESAATRLKSESLWESDYAEMEKLQTIILPPTKPTGDNALTRKFQVETRRGD